MGEGVVCSAVQNHFQNVKLSQRIALYSDLYYYCLLLRFCVSFLMKWINVVVDVDKCVTKMLLNVCDTVMQDNID